MPNYRVDWWESHSTEVEVDNEDEAFDRAMDKAGGTNTCVDIPSVRVLIEKIINKENKMTKEYEVTYKFGDVGYTIKAESQEEAQKIADERLESNLSPQNDTRCYEVEVEEIKNE